MSDGVDKGVVLLVATDLADQKSRIEKDSKDENRKEYDAEHQEGDFTRVEQDPTHIQRDRQSDETRAERDENCY